MNNETKRFTFRLPNENFDKLNALAQQEHRTANNMLNYILENYLKKMEKTVDSTTSVWHHKDVGQRGLPYGNN